MTPGGTRNGSARSVAVLGAVRAEAMLTDLLDELAGAGAELLARERRAG